MPSPSVSVILTVYKRIGFLEAAIRSVLAQTFQDFELVVSDDASQNSTRDLCAAFQADSRVRYRRNTRNLGTPLNIAAALAESQADYVCVLNDDDLMNPHMIEALLSPLRENSELVMSFGDFEVIGVSGEKLADATAELPGLRLRSGLRPGVVPCPEKFTLRRGVMICLGAMVRRSALNSAWFVPEVAGAYDYWLAVQLALTGPIYYRPGCVMQWRQHADAETMRYHLTRFAPEIFISDKLLDKFKDADDRWFLRQQLARYYYWQAGQALREDQTMTRARHALRRSLSLCFSWHTLAGLGLAYTPRTLRNIVLRMFNKHQPYALRCKSV